MNSKNRKSCIKNSLEVEISPVFPIDIDIANKLHGHGLLKGLIEEPSTDAVLFSSFSDKVHSCDGSL